LPGFVSRTSRSLAGTTNVAAYFALRDVRRTALTNRGNRTGRQNDLDFIGRGERIRTSDPLRPRQVRYQAALRPDPQPIVSERRPPRPELTTPASFTCQTRRMRSRKRKTASRKSRSRGRKRCAAIDARQDYGRRARSGERKLEAEPETSRAARITRRAGPKSSRRRPAESNSGGATPERTTESRSGARESTQRPGAVAPVRMAR
jgi:hypothetical protein